MYTFYRCINKCNFNTAYIVYFCNNILTFFIHSTLCIVFRRMINYTKYTVNLFFELIPDNNNYNYLLIYAG